MLLAEPSTTEAIKYDTGKARLDLLDPIAIEGLAKVLQFGADRYSDNNWRNGLKWSRIIAALLRHTFAIMRGEDVDPDSGLLHADHVMCNAMFLSNHFREHPELDDRYKAK
jgi:hypothetical protein